MKTDVCTYFTINNSAIMGRLVRFDDIPNTILNKHDYPEDVAGVVAESIALAALLAGSIKYDGLFTLQFQTNGAISILVVDVSSDGKIRSCATFDPHKIEKIRNPNEKYKLREGETLEAPHWLGGGHLAFTVDQGKETELYQGIVEIKGKTLSEVAAGYFKQSEQIETHIKLFLEHKNGRWHSAGIMLQKLPQKGPGEDTGLDKAWEEAVVFAESLKKEEIFDHTLSSEELLNRLYHSSGLKITNRKQYAFGCRCGKDKILDTLSSFSEDDIDHMCQNNKIYVDCSFCGEKYIFDRGELIKH